MRIHFTLNGIPRDHEVEPLDRALDVLRALGVTGTKEGCGEGECGTCTILMNDLPVNACLVIAAHLDGSTVVTVEGLADGTVLSPLQSAFIDRGATQCGICTPGMLIAADYFLRELRRTPNAVALDDGTTLPRFDIDAVRSWAASSAGDEPLHAGGALDAAVDREIRACLAGNLCRCTGYESIVRAVKDAARESVATLLARGI